MSGPRNAATSNPFDLPVIRVLLQGRVDKPLILQTLQPDLLRWDVTRNKHRWPHFKQAESLWITFLAWSAATRTGETTMPWPQWEIECLQALPINDQPDAGTDEADPFQQDPGGD